MDYIHSILNKSDYISFKLVGHNNIVKLEYDTSSILKVVDHVKPNPMYYAWCF